MRILLCFVVAASFLPAQKSKFSPALAQREDVRKALAFIDKNFDAQVEEWIRLTEIPAPSGHEAARAAYVKAEMEKAGLVASVDASGNVMATRKGSGGGPAVVFAAHMDTVFPLGTNVKVTRKPDGTLHAPGVGDNTASVANMLQTIRALKDANVQTKGDVIFLATVREEVGLKGMYEWFERNRDTAKMIVALDSAMGPVYYGALGIYWSKMKFNGPGAHTNRSRGVPNPVLAAARCITEIYTVPLPDAGAPVSAVYNVGGMISGGNIVNAVPEEVTFTVDLRTVDKQMLATLDDAIVSKCDAAARAQKVKFTREWIQKSEAGGRPEELEAQRKHPLVQTAVDVIRHLGIPLIKGQEAIATGSTDANVGVVHGIPSVSVGRANTYDGHTLREWANIESAKLGTKQIILLAAALTEPD